MLRTTLDKAYLKRTIRPLYGWTQTTPKSAFLDPAFDYVALGTPVYPGMVMTHVGGAGGNDLYTLAIADGDIPAGLSGLYIGGDGIDEVADSGINALAVWVLGPDAEFEILAPAFTDFAGTEVSGSLVHFAGTGETTKRGKLVPAGFANASTRPVAKLLKIVDSTKIVIGGLQGTVA